MRVSQEKGKPGKFHFHALAAYISETRQAGGIPFPGDGPEVVTAPPANGQHTDDVLREAGYSAEETASLRADGVV